jgi:hypothetical protein
MLPRQIRLQFGVETVNVFQMKDFKVDIMPATTPAEEEGSGS